MVKILKSPDCFIWGLRYSKINRNWMKLKFFVNRETQHLELRVFSFNLYVYFLTRDYIGSTHAFNLVNRDFNP